MPQAVRARWGDKGVIDLAMALQMGRTFPMMKAALGYARECRRVTVDGHQVDVINRLHENDPLAPHRRRLLGLAYPMLGSRSDAEDIVQDAYLRFAGAENVRNTEAMP